jgi:hypothetical protein
MKKVFMFAAMASVLMASCSKNEDSPVATKSDTNEMGITAKALSDVVITRGLVSSFLANDQVAVFVNGTGYTPVVAKYSKVDDSSPWAFPTDAATKIYLSNETAKVYGFCPAGAVATLANDGSSTIAVSVPAADGFNASAQDDYMYATAATPDAGVTYPLAIATNATATDGHKVDLVFHHALSKLSFVVNRGATYTGTGALSEVKLESTDALAPFNVTDVANAGTMKVADGTFTFATTAAMLDFTGTAIIINPLTDPASTVHTTEQIVAPKLSTANITLSLKIDGKVMSVTLPATAVAAWLPGKNYVYTITVNGTQLIVKSVTILNWNDVDAGSADVN